MEFVVGRQPVTMEFLTGFESTYMPDQDMDVLETTRHLDLFHHDLELVAEAGIHTLRYPVPWHRIEREPGSYDWSWMDAVMRSLAGPGARPDRRSDSPYVVSCLAGSRLPGRPVRRERTPALSRRLPIAIRGCGATRPSTSRCRPRSFARTRASGSRTRDTSATGCAWHVMSRLPSRVSLGFLSRGTRTSRSSTSTRAKRTMPWTRNRSPGRAT